MCALQAHGDGSGISSRILPGSHVQERLLAPAARHESAGVQFPQLRRVVLEASVARQDDEVRRAGVGAAVSSRCKPHREESERIEYVVLRPTTSLSERSSLHTVHRNTVQLLTGCLHRWQMRTRGEQDTATQHSGVTAQTCHACITVLGP